MYKCVPNQALDGGKGERWLLRPGEGVLGVHGAGGVCTQSMQSTGRKEAREKNDSWYCLTVLMRLGFRDLHWHIWHMFL